jgi:SIR2-like protein
VAEFRRRLLGETLELHRGFKGTTGGGGLCCLAETACEMLHWVVYYKLTEGKLRLGLDAITETAKRVKTLDIFTLNHDVLVECQCKADDVAYEDGFADRRGELRIFSDWPLERRERVRIFKLHGSVNWFLYDFPGWARAYAIPDKDAFHSLDQNGKLVKPVQGKSSFLSGAVVKQQSYVVGIFGDIFAAFRHHLRNHTHLICCGYGFGDSGINNCLQQWLCDAHDKKLVVLNQGREEDFFAVKPSWLRQMHLHERLVYVAKWLQDCQFDDLYRYCDE